MADKVSDLIEKGLVMLNSKKARYDIRKVEQQSVHKAHEQEVTVISYRIFPETTVKTDASEATVACRRCRSRSNSRTVKMTCFFGGALVATVLVTAIFAICITRRTTLAASYCLHFTGDYRFELVTLDDDEDTLGNLRNHNTRASPPQVKSSRPRVIAESGSISFNRSNEFKETILARELPTISTGQARRFDKLGANLTLDDHFFEITCPELLLKYNNTSVTDALNWIIWMHQNLPKCLTEVAPFLTLPNTPSAAPTDEDGESDEELDSDEDMPNEK